MESLVFRHILQAKPVPLGPLRTHTTGSPFAIIRVHYTYCEQLLLLTQHLTVCFTYSLPLRWRSVNECGNVPFVKNSGSFYS